MRVSGQLHAPLSAELAAWLLEFPLDANQLIDMLQTLRKFFPNHPLRVEVAQEEPFLRIWVFGSEDIDSDLEALERFDQIWSIHRSDKEKRRFIALLE